MPPTHPAPRPRPQPALDCFYKQGGQGHVGRGIVYWPTSKRPTPNLFTRAPWPDHPSLPPGPDRRSERGWAQTDRTLWALAGWGGLMLGLAGAALLGALGCH